MSKKGEKKDTQPKQEAVKKKKAATYKVVKPFRDRYSGELYEGGVYKAGAARLKELAEKGFIEEVKDDEPGE